MARLDRATQPARVGALIQILHRLDGPLLRAMTILELIGSKGR
jgi:hypothetical protein